MVVVDALMRRLLLVLLVLTGGYIALAVILGTPQFLATVTSNSMAPALERGDWVVLQKQAGYQVRDVVVFSVSGSVFVHRVVARTSGGLYRTKGDAVAQSDGWSLPPDAVMGKVVLRIPRLGYLSLWLGGH